MRFHPGTKWFYTVSTDICGRLVEIMSEIHALCHDTAERYGAPGDYVAGANMAGFVRVADAMLALGLV